MAYVVEKAQERKPYEEEPQTFSQKIMEPLGDFMWEWLKNAPAAAAGFPGDIASMTPDQEVFLKEHGTPTERLWETSDEELLPQNFDLSALSFLPTTQGIKDYFGYRKPETTAQKGGARAGDITGPGLFSLLFGGGAAAVPAVLRQSFISSLAGQGAEAAGFGPVGQAVAETVAGIPSGSRMAKQAVKSANPKVQRHLAQAEKLGVSEGTRLLSQKGAEKSTRLAKLAGGTEKAEHALESARNEITHALERYKKNNILNYDKGRDFLEADKGRVLSETAKYMEKVPIKDTKPLVNAVDQLIKDVKQVPGLNPDRKATLEFLQAQRDSFASGLNAQGEPLIASDLYNLYRDINSKFSSWLNSNAKRQSNVRLKQSLISAVEKSDPEAGRLFKQSNEYYKKYLKTNDALDRMAGYFKEGHVNYKSLRDDLNKPEYRKLYTDVMGKTAVNDLETLAKVSDNVGKIEKAFNSKTMKHYLEKGSATAVAGAIAGAASGNVGLLNASAFGLPWMGTKFTEQLAARLLTDPRYQHMTAGFMEALLKDNPRKVAHLANKMERLLREDAANEPEQGKKPAAQQPKTGKPRYNVVKAAA